MATVNKCPACGCLRQSFAAVCPDCGYEFSDIQSSDTLLRFGEKINEYDRLIFQDGNKNKKEKCGVGFLMICLWLFFFPVMVVIYLFKKLRVRNGDLQGADKLKSEAILNFPIPNNRNDLMEFALMIETRVKPLNYFQVISDSGMEVQKWNRIWLEKANHIEKKAQIALADDASSLRQIRASRQKAEEVVKRNNQLNWIMMGGLFALFVLFIIYASYQ